jgi:hypothetical protein
MNVVAQNANSGSAFLSRSELDEFLFAPVIDDANGMTVSVLSMLARAGVDPRSKAAELARMTVGKATDTLTSFIGESLQGLLSHDDTETIAARLAALLPPRTNPINPPGQTKIGNTELTQAHAVWIAAILVCLLMGAIWATAAHQSPARVGGTGPASSAAIAAPTPPSHAVNRLGVPAPIDMIML